MQLSFGSDHGSDAVAVWKWCRWVLEVMALDFGSIPSHSRSKKSGTAERCVSMISRLFHRHIGSAERLFHSRWVLEVMVMSFGSDCGSDAVRRHACQNLPAPLMHVQICPTPCMSKSALPQCVSKSARRHAYQNLNRFWMVFWLIWCNGRTWILHHKVTLFSRIHSQ